MPRSVHYDKPVGDQFKGTKNLKLQLAAKRRLAKNIQLTGRRRDSKMEKDL